MAQNPRLTGVWWLCKMNAEWCLAEGILTNVNCLVTSMGYNVLNVCFLSSSLVLVLRLVALQPEVRNCGLGFHLLAQEFLAGFLPTAFMGVLVVMWRCHRSATRTECIEHEAKLYIL